MNLRIKLFVVVIAVGLVASMVIAPKIAVAFGGGDGLSEGTAFQIEDCQDLQDMANDLDAYYELSNDIDCSDSATWNAGTGFTPVGTSGSRFVGQLDGNDFTVSELYINLDGTDDKGIFGFVGAGGLVSDVNMTDAYIRGRYNIGTIAGVNYGTITGSSSSGTILAYGSGGGISGGAFGGGTISDSQSSVDVITADARAGGIVAWCDPCTLTDVIATGDVSGSYYVGGVVGTATSSTMSGLQGHGNVTATDQYAGGAVGYVAGTSTLTLSYATGDVTSTIDFGNGATGGFVGAVFNATNVTKSYATGNVINTTGGAVGGFVGLIGSGGSVTNVFARGTATGETTTGGLVGNSDGFGLANTITNGYSTGTATSGATTGGLQGASNQSTTVNSYWDTESSGNATSVTGTGLETADMKLEESFNNWDFETVWFIDEDTNNGYPCLQDLGGICTLGSTAPPTTTTTTTTTTPVSNADEDGDGIADATEDSAPNNGDGNGDGTPDAEQVNVTSLPSTTGAGFITVASPEGTVIASTSSSPESDSVKDDEFDYKFGLVSFTVTGVTPGETIEMNVYFATNEAADSFIGRKFINGEYSTLEGSSLQSVLVGSTPALRLTYGLTDGGELDEDGEANGTIIDPVGLGSAPGDLAATGLQSIQLLLVGMVLCLVGVFVAKLSRKNKAFFRIQLLKLYSS